MFNNIKKEIKKQLCYNVGTYKDHKYGVPYFDLIIGIFIWIIIAAIGIYVTVGILLVLYDIIIRPEYFYNIVLIKLIQAWNSTKFWNLVVVVIFSVTIAYAFVRLGFGKFLSKHAFVCDRLQPSPEVMELYDHIMILDIHKKKEFIRLINSLQTQLNRDIKKSKEVK